MSTPMMDNLLAAFKKAPPSPLYGKPLVYLLGSSAETFREIPGSIIEPPYGKNAIGTADKIAYVNLFDEENSGELGPYLHDSDTADQYSEGQIDPDGPGWTKNLTAQFVRAAGNGYRFAELDNPDAYSVGVVQKVITMAHGYGLGVIAKNSKLVEGGALQILSHQNVAGLIVERDCGDPAYYNALRTQARKDGLLPVWFVFDGRDGSDECAAAIRAHGFKGMGVSYSTGREKNGYNDSHTVLTPVV